jgi:hypothetical protein
MWKCKHCQSQFEFKSISERANHSRWCFSNPKRFETKNLKEAQSLSLDRRLGIFKNFEVSCATCSTLIVVKEREKNFPSKKKYFCSRSCANSSVEKQNQKSIIMMKLQVTKLLRGDIINECCVCKESKIVAFHHLDENHNNNDPKNLVPLCPTHHHYMHSRFKLEIQKIVEEYVRSKWAVSVVGGTQALQA